MTSAPPGQTAGDEPYDGPPATVPPGPGAWAPPPWQPAPWRPAPWQPGPPQPAEPPPWAQERWGPAAWEVPAWRSGPSWQPRPAEYPPRWLPPGTPPHDEAQPFLLAMRSRSWRWWRPALGLLLFAVVYLIASILALVVGGIGLVLTGEIDLTEQEPDFSATGVLLLINLVTAVAIPVVWAAWGAAHRMRIGWSSSVLGRLRWRLFPAYTGIALLTIGVSIAVSAILAVVAGDIEVAGPVESYGWLLLVVLLTTPLQSAAEEYIFRGYLSQAVAGWVRDPRAGAVTAGILTATLFSLAHLPPDLPTFLVYFAVGLAASAVVWLTGGLEAAIALHAVNNVVIFVLYGAIGVDVVSISGSQVGVPWPDLLLTMVALSAFVALVARSRRRRPPETRTAALDLRLPMQPVLVPAR